MAYKVVNFDDDTIELLFFHDLIHVEIKAPNLVKDLSVKSFDEPDWSRYANYPVKHINVRSLIDSNGPKDKEKTQPIQLRYCMDLIIKEIGQGDIVTTKKQYKCVKELSKVQLAIYYLCLDPSFSFLVKTYKINSFNSF
jgi:hypothetical protein